MEEITDEQRFVLQIKFEDGSKLYVNNYHFVSVSDPCYATRYAPIDDKYPQREEGRKKDMKWMESSFDAEIKFVPLVDACKEYNKLNAETYDQ